ncbi:MAG: LIC_13387 family protein [Chitinophagales bacterium]
MTTSIILYLIGSTLFIIIGILHTIVHFKELVSDEVQQKISSIGRIKVAGANAEVWKLWQGMSLLFGVLLSVLGLNNILALQTNTSPPLYITLVTMAVLLLVMYSGKKYFGNMQFYGGMFGFVLFGLSLYLG